ncbi:SemiSWEET family sugar transporter [Brevundimonas sp. NPDC092305]|uniref:SemiSWEET family sugar transporter n=1 Tax=Brevundimonas sp. NPDC092305 TaxID=3363957 RepID=UPI0037F3E9D7
MSQIWANVVGTGAALCSIASFAPQMIKIWRDKDASAVSLKTYSLTVIGFILWTTYGVISGAWPIIVANSCALAMSAVVLGLKWKFSRSGDRG